jgi:glycerate 2-kinase
MDNMPIAAMEDRILPGSAGPNSVLVAPDSFKGTYSAAEVARAIGLGLMQSGFVVDFCPVADGGEGTMAALAPALGAVEQFAQAADPLGMPIEASFAIVGDVAIVETASASGLNLVDESERDPFAASTEGTGDLIAAAIDSGARTVYLGVGGSATTDGGMGAIAAIERQGGLRGARLVVLCDVRVAFEDAARVFGPQKGADPEMVETLTGRLHEFAVGFPRDPRGLPMTGAAGGLSGGLWAALGADLVPGAAFVLDLLDFDVRVARARAVITGEGRLDAQTLTGKVVSEVAERARQAGVPCYAVVGSCTATPAEVVELSLQQAIEATDLEQMETAGRRLGELLALPSLP